MKVKSNGIQVELRLSRVGPFNIREVVSYAMG